MKVLDLLRYDRTMALPEGRKAFVPAIVLATYQRGDIEVIRFIPFGPVDRTMLVGADWTWYAMRPDVDGEKLRVKLGVANDNRIEVVVEDLLPDSKLTHFLIGEKDWKSGQVHSVEPAMRKIDRGWDEK